jgi:hypothetical protein
MDEARRVIARLDRIEALQRGRAPAAALLAEVRLLLREGEAWLAAERAGTEAAGTALDRCRDRLAHGREVEPRRVQEALL